MGPWGFEKAQGDEGARGGEQQINVIDGISAEGQAGGGDCDGDGDDGSGGDRSAKKLRQGTGGGRDGLGVFEINVGGEDSYGIDIHGNNDRVNKSEVQPLQPLQPLQHAAHEERYEVTENRGRGSSKAVGDIEDGSKSEILKRRARQDFLFRSFLRRSFSHSLVWIMISWPDLKQHQLASTPGRGVECDT